MLNIYKINDSKFKSIYLSCNFIMPVNRNQNSENALLGSVLGKACKQYPTQAEIEKYLYGLYGTDFNVNIEKLGDLYNIEFKVQFVHKDFLPDKQDVSDKVIEFLYQVIYAPYLVNGVFDSTIVEREKKVILNKIMERKDDKLRYSVQRMEQLLCPNEAFGMDLYGEEEIINAITPERLYQRYLEVIQGSCVTFLLSGDLEKYEDLEDKLKKKFEPKLENHLKLDEMIYDDVKREMKNKIEEEKEIQDTVQSVLSIGAVIENYQVQDYYALNVYNTILGGTPSSKLFQNVREKESLAYTVRSRYYRFKPILIIFSGIMQENYEKAKNLILEQMQDMKKGNISHIEFSSAKESLVADLLEWNDSKIALAKMQLSNVLAFQSEEVTLDQMIEQIKKVTLEDVIRVANKVHVEKVFLLGGNENV